MELIWCMERKMLVHSSSNQFEKFIGNWAVSLVVTSPLLFTLDLVTVSIKNLTKNKISFKQRPYFVILSLFFFFTKSLMYAHNACILFFFPKGRWLKVPDLMHFTWAFQWGVAKTQNGKRNGMVYGKFYIVIYLIYVLNKLKMIYFLYSLILLNCYPYIQGYFF